MFDIFWGLRARVLQPNFTDTLADFRSKSFKNLEFGGQKSGYFWFLKMKKKSSKFSKAEMKKNPKNSKKSFFLKMFKNTWTML